MGESPLKPGSRIGRFLVLETLGSGAMGVVVAARDPELDRRIAVKIVRPHALGIEGTAESRARLLREARAMARLSHPNILTVYDVGSFGDEVFIAMEYAAGGTLREWRAAGERSWRQILELHLRAGRGLWAAHQAKLVHRDYKPDNVLLTDGGGVRVADFGLVGVEIDRTGDMASRELGVTLTQTGTLVGTPAYMAPEQHRREPATAASDQFAFCVALYEALYGERPFSGGTIGEVADNVLSGRIVDAPKRTPVPSRVRALLLRGLAVDPADRFPSMGALLDALDRARRRRRPWLLGAAALVTAGAVTAFAAIGGGDPETRCDTGKRQLAGVWDDAQRGQARQAFLAVDKPYAPDTWNRVEGLLDGYAEQWTTRFDAVCAATVRGDESEEVLALRLGCLHDRKRDLAALTDVFADADETVVLRAAGAVAGLERLELCDDVDALRLPYAPPPPEQRSSVAALREQLARLDALEKAGKYADGLSLAKQTLASANELGYKPIIAEALNQIGRLNWRIGNYAAGAKQLEDAMWTADRANHDDVRVRAARLLVYVTGYSMGDSEQADKWARLADVAVDRVGRGGTYEAGYLNNWASALNMRGDYDQAQELLQRALEIYEQTLGPDHYLVATVSNNLANAWYGKGDIDAAMKYQLRALKINETALGREHPEVAKYHMNLGRLLLANGAPDEALEHHRHALAIAESSLGPEHPMVGGILNGTGEVFRVRGDHDEALHYYRRAIAVWDALYGPDDHRTAQATSNMGLALLGLDRPTEAIPWFEQAMTTCEKIDCFPEHVAETWFGLARALAASGADRRRAVELGREARDRYAELRSKTAQQAVRDIDEWLARRAKHSSSD